MGSGTLQFLTPFFTSPPKPSSLGHRFSLHNHSSIPTCCFATSSGGRDSPSESSTSKFGKEQFRWDDEVSADKEEGFGFGTAAKQRVWWSDDSSSYWDDDDEDDDEFDGFGVMEGSIDFAWVAKVFRAFGWMVPAIIMSAVLGTGTNTFIMALALPLAQSALSLVMDAIWGWSDEGPRSKSKKKRKPFSRAARDPGIRMGKGQNTQNGKGVRDSQSWAASNGAPDQAKAKNTQSFGGWDELDNRGMEGAPKNRPTRRPNGPRQWTNGKLSKRIGSRETPLLLRLLIAVFPFLGSWTKLL